MSKIISSTESCTQPRVLLLSFYTEIWVQTMKAYKIREGSRWHFYSFLFPLNLGKASTCQELLQLYSLRAEKLINSYSLQEKIKQPFPWQMLQKASTISLQSRSVPQQGINTNFRMAIVATENWHKGKLEPITLQSSQESVSGIFLSL